MLLTILLACTTSSASAGDGPLMAADSTHYPKPSKRELTLDDIKDCAILLKQIRQQAINIYEEAGREKVRLDASAEVPDVTSIPYQIVGKDLLPPRREWLIFYLGSMEPVIRDLGEEVGTSPGGLNPVIPEAYTASFKTFWEQWAADVNKLNKHLDDLVPLFDDAPHNNSKIQQVAVSIYQDVDSLETLRRQIFKGVQEVLKENPDSHILITPP